MQSVETFDNLHKYLLGKGYSGVSKSSEGFAMQLGVKLPDDYHQQIYQRSDEYAQEMERQQALPHWD
jgi:hypothetical protein